jgi:lycopene cyclase domain-containing protein
MKAEYLIFNLFILAGPIIFSFDRHVRFVSQWIRSLLSAILVSIPFLVWDILVTGRHWWFNPRYTLTVKLFRLPIEEWLFFISVPFACLFIWEIIIIKQKPSLTIQMPLHRFLPPVFLLLGVLFLTTGKVYTGLSFCMLGIAVLADYLLKTSLILFKAFYQYLLIVTGLMFIFNGYLTARPVVVYEIPYQLNIRIWTIPIEDFIYAFSLILLNTVLYQKLRKVS